MEISTIKYNKNGKPSRAKWRIVVLGNFDPHTWSTNECFSPVMSMLELCLLVSLVVHHKNTLRSGDVKQELCQESLTLDEQYILRSPASCPNTPTNTL